MAKKKNLPPQEIELGDMVSFVLETDEQEIVFEGSVIRSPVSTGGLVGHYSVLVYRCNLEQVSQTLRDAPGTLVIDVKPGDLTPISKPDAIELSVFAEMYI